jgi:WD repeat-containing protein 48
MHRVGSAGNTTGSTRPRKEKRFTYVLNDADDKKVCFTVKYPLLAALLICYLRSTSSQLFSII